MCQFLSALVVRNGDILWHEATDSHSDLVAHFKMPENAGCKHFAKVEFTPPEKDGRPIYEDFANYKLRVDEDTEPSWFEELRNGVEKKLRSIIQSMIIDDARPMVLGGCRILVSGAKVDALKSSRVVSMSGTSSVGVMFGTSSVGVMCDTSSVGVMCDTSSVGVMCDTSSVGQMCDTSSVRVMSGKSVAPKTPADDRRKKEEATNA